MDALHLLSDLKTVDKWSRVKVVGLSGTQELIQDSIDRIIDKSLDKVVYHLHPKSMKQVFEAVAQTDVDAAPCLFILHDALHLISESDLLKLDRLSHKNYFSTLLVFTGHFSAEVSKKDFTRASQRFYDLDFKKTDSGRQRAVKWLCSITRCDDSAADMILKETDFDLSRVYYLAKKIEVFDTFTAQDVALLATEFAPHRFVYALLNLDYVNAMKMAEQVPQYAIVWVLTDLTRYLRTIGQVHPVTRQVKAPTRQQVIDSKIDLGTLQRWWTIAGRYTPEQQISRHIIIAEACHRYYTVSKKGILENLVLAW